jgi:hypothetical protein
MEEATDGLSKGLVRCACNESAVMTSMRAMCHGACLQVSVVTARVAYVVLLQELQ